MKAVNTRGATNALMNIYGMEIPADRAVFRLKVEETEGNWRVNGYINSIAGTLTDGCPCPSIHILPLSDLCFPSEREAYDFAKQVHNVLLERGATPEGKSIRFSV